MFPFNPNDWHAAAVELGFSLKAERSYFKPRGCYFESQVIDATHRTTEMRYNLGLG